MKDQAFTLEVVSNFIVWSNQQFLFLQQHALGAALDKSNLKAEAFKTGIVKAVFHVMSLEQQEEIRKMEQMTILESSNSRARAAPNANPAQKSQEDEKTYETGRAVLSGTV